MHPWRKKKCVISKMWILVFLRRIHWIENRDHISLLVGTPRCPPRRAAGGDRGDGGLGISATKTPISDGNWTHVSGLHISTTYTQSKLMDLEHFCVRCLWGGPTPQPLKQEITAAVHHWSQYLITEYWLQLELMCNVEVNAHGRIPSPCRVRASNGTNTDLIFCSLNVTHHKERELSRSDVQKWVMRMSHLPTILKDGVLTKLKLKNMQEVFWVLIFINSLKFSSLRSRWCTCLSQYLSYWVKYTANKLQLMLTLTKTHSAFQTAVNRVLF